MSADRYDLLLLADCHGEDARAQDLVEDIRAQHQAGFTTALMDLPEQRDGRQRPFAESIRACIRDGLVDLVPTRAKTESRLALIHSPQALLAAAKPPLFTAGQTVALLEEPTPDHAPRTGDRPLGAIVAATGAAHPSVVWAPRGPHARAALAGAGATLLEDDWTPVIDASDRLVIRPAAQRAPVVGRIAPSVAAAWPADATGLLAAYPDDPSTPVRFLGDVGAAVRIIGRPPANWIVYPSGALRMSDFLGRIDAYVEAIARDAALSPGRSVLLALASGLPAIVPERWREQLGDACLAGEAAAVPGLLAELRADPALGEKLAARARELLEERYDRRRHAARIEAVIGPPTTAARPRPAPRPRPVRRRVLFVSSNGAGVGHLMRLMSIARRTPEDVEPIFFTLSQAVQAVRRMDFPVEYMPSHHYAHLPGSLWHPLLRRRLASLIDLYRPSAVVFDGTAPYRGLVQAMAARPHLPFVWSRRAMWKPGLGARAMETADAFHLILEPGEVAGERDHGATVAARDHVTRTPPVILFDPDELLEPAAAKRELGLDPDRPAALVQLGAGNINDISSMQGAVVQRLLREDGLQVCVTSSIIGASTTPAFERVTKLSVYPLGRFLRAFDLAVAASGYNTYHELIAARVPSIFVPNLETALDDQGARAAFAQDAGFGFALPTLDEGALDRAVTALLDPDARAAMSARCAEVMPEGGGRAAAEALTAFLDSWERAGAGLRARAPKPADRDESRRGDLTRRLARKAEVAVQRYTPSVRKNVRRRYRLASMIIAGDERAAAKASRVPVSPGLGIDPVQAAGLPVLMVLAWGTPERDLDDLVEEIAHLQGSRRSFTPLFVTDSDDFARFRRWQYVFEYVMPEEAWSAMEHPTSWEAYRSGRLSQLLRDYAPEYIVTAESWAGFRPVLHAFATEAR